MGAAHDVTHLHSFLIVGVRNAGKIWFPQGGDNDSE
jgi:hypothetical protein